MWSTQTFPIFSSRVSTGNFAPLDTVACQLCVERHGARVERCVQRIQWSLHFPSAQVAAMAVPNASLEGHQVILSPYRWDPGTWEGKGGIHWLPWLIIQEKTTMHGLKFLYNFWRSKINGRIQWSFMKFQGKLLLCNGVSARFDANELRWLPTGEAAAKVHMSKEAGVVFWKTR